MACGVVTLLTAGTAAGAEPGGTGALLLGALLGALLIVPCAAGLDSPIDEMAQPRPELFAHVPPACSCRSHATVFCEELLPAAGGTSRYFQHHVESLQQ